MTGMKRSSVYRLALLAAAALLTGSVGRTAGDVDSGAVGGESATGARANRLIHESSPYLRLHAYNPVDWYPWGPEALERARREQKPIFLSVGYSTCYWCHVMEREVFENPELAELMNRWFVNIKVDREERPELDEIYMTATQLLTRHGGWPNSVFLTPDLEPFFAGTYFPPEDSDGRAGFRTVLTTLNRHWTTNRERVESEAHRIAQAIREVLTGNRAAPVALPARAAAEQAVARLAERYDAANGGFGGGPKFPSPSNLYLLWGRAEEGDAASRRMVIDTLKRMGRGAIYDQLDGGFHRYTLDAEWRIPHFEKMLYDNAHLGELLAVTAAATGDAELERLARGTLDFVLEWLRLPNGAFKSAIDAETDAVEGAYYVWTREELQRAAGDEGYRLLAPLFGLDGEPNFEGDRYTLYLTRSLDERAAELELGRAQLLAAIEPHLESLRRARSKREFPLVDDKVLVDWNGMMIAALARAGGLLEEPAYVEAAARAADFVLTLRDAQGVLLHTWRDGTAKVPAFLDDYAFLTRGLLALHEVTGGARWLTEAERLAEELERRLRAPTGGYYMSEARPDLLLQVVSPADGAIPSGNGVAVLNLLELAGRTGRAVYRERAEAALGAFARDLETYPQAVTTLALAVLRGGAASAPRIAATASESSKTRPAGAPGGSTEALARDVVRVSGRFDGPPAADGWRPFTIELDIREGWHVNANPASLDFLIPTAVEGGVRDLAYPAGESFRFEFAPEEISVYSGTATVRGQASPESPELQVTYQACDDRRCLPPVTESVRLE